MRIASVTKDGVQVVIYNQKTCDYYYEDGTRIPDEKRKGFKSTIFKEPPNPIKNISQDELDNQIAKIHAELKADSEAIKDI